LTLIGDLLILLRKHRIKPTLAALAHSRLHKSALPWEEAVNFLCPLIAQINKTDFPADNQ
jgi:hypothetical protein